MIPLPWKHCLYFQGGRRQDFVRQGGRTLLDPAAQTFPRAKDINNKLKFVIAALQGGGLFNNDVMITKVIITKMFAQNAKAGGWTEVQLSTSPEAPPLATSVLV
jgi:hypothetical protein